MLIAALSYRASVADRRKERAAEQVKRVKLTVTSTDEDGGNRVRVRVVNQSDQTMRQVGVQLRPELLHPIWNVMLFRDNVPVEVDPTVKANGDQWYELAGSWHDVLYPGESFSKTGFFSGVDISTDEIAVHFILARYYWVLFPGGNFHRQRRGLLYDVETRRQNKHFERWKSEQLKSSSGDAGRNTITGEATSTEGDER